MKKDYIFVYKTVNLLNNKIYVGVHKTKRLEDGYIGCGVYSERSLQTKILSRQKENRRISPFLTAVQKYGYSNFKCKILKFFDSYEDALKYEQLIVTQKFIDSEKTYNCSIGGRGSSKSVEHRKILSEKMKLNNPMKNPIIANFVNSKKRGSKHSEETKLKIQIKLKTICSSAEQKQRLSKQGKTKRKSTSNE